MLGLFVGTVTNARHQILTLEASTHSVINTFWFPPVALQKVRLCLQKFCEINNFLYNKLPLV